jgi:porin
MRPFCAPCQHGTRQRAQGSANPRGTDCRAYQSGYEGGLILRGTAWGRSADNIGIGYGHAHGGTSPIFQSDVIDCYYRFAVDESLALTADVQWMKDRDRDADDIEGWIFGARAVVEF